MGFDRTAMAGRGLITPAAMARADQRTIDAGTPRGTLVARAARAVFRVLRAEFLRQPVTVLVGPGQNGEDGYLLASLLQEAGWPLSIIDIDAGADTKRAEDEGLAGHLRPSGTFVPGPGMLVVDALFGAGLSRDIEGEAKALLEKLDGSGAKVLSIDLPSGIDGATGDIRGAAPTADVTVTFHRLKPGHLIGAGAERAGRLFCIDIGIEGLAKDASALHNHPSLWRHLLTTDGRETHKYARGHCAVIGGPGLRGGAARLSARTASISGAGAVTYFSPLSGAEFAASAFDAVMVRPLLDPDELEQQLSEKVSAVVIGPGMGHGHLASDCLTVVLESGLPCILDADALTLHEDNPQTFFEMLHERCVLTPHEGEFARLFPEATGDKLTRAKAAAEMTGATVLLKGSTTVIAGQGLPVLSTTGGPALATAGSGDVLSGLIGGFLATGLGPTEAAAAAAWIHGEAGRGGGRALNADRLPERIARTLNRTLHP